MSRFAVIGIDPGFAAIGLAVVECYGDVRKVTHFECLTTEAESKKRKVLSVEDNVRRGTEIARHLRELLAITNARIPVAAFGAEAMSHPRNAGAAAKVAITWGALIMLSEATATPIVQASPQQVKRAVFGQKTATKEQIQRAVAKLYPEIKPIRATIRDTLWEHPHDALAAAHVALDSQSLAALAKVA